MSAVAALLAVVLVGCSAAVSADSDPPEADARVDVVATITILGDLAEEVGGDHVRVTTLVPVGGDPHVFEPTPSVAAAIEDADVVLANGLGLEPWFDPLSARAGERLTVVTDGLGPLVVDDEAGDPDPHLWMVPTVVAEGYVPTIRDALIATVPAASDELAARATALQDELLELDEQLRERVGTIDPARRRLVTSHDAYTYFAEHYGFEVLGTVFGISTEREPSAGEIAALVDEVRDADVPTIFVETTIDPRLVERVARDADVEVGAPLYGDSVGPPGSGAEDYAGMMHANIDALVAGLG